MTMRGGIDNDEGENQQRGESKTGRIDNDKESMARRKGINEEEVGVIDEEEEVGT